MAVTRSTLPVTTVTANTTLTVADQFILSNGANTLQLYSGTGNMGRSLVIKNIHATVNVSVLANSGQTIDGASNTVLLPTQTLNIICNGSSWLTVGANNIFTGNVGVGTSAPLAKFEVLGTAAAAANSGNTMDGFVSIRATNDVAMHIGHLSASPYGAWIQVRDRTNFANKYPLTLQPTGGDVQIVPGVKERNRTVAMGEWITPAFSNTNFTAMGSMTWNVESADCVTYAYTLVGKKMTVAWALGGTTIGGSANTTLYIAIPGSFVAAKTMLNSAWFSSGGTKFTGYCIVTAGDTKIGLSKNDGSNFATETNSMATFGELTFEVQ